MCGRWHQGAMATPARVKGPPGAFATACTQREFVCHAARVQFPAISETNMCHNPSRPRAMFPPHVLALGGEGPGKPFSAAGAAMGLKRSSPHVPPPQGA